MQLVCIIRAHDFELDVGVHVGAQRVEDDDVDSARGELLDHLSADEAGAAGDQDSHGQRSHPDHHRDAGPDRFG